MRSSSQQFLTGFAWTMIIVSAWACLRTSYWLILHASDSLQEGQILGMHSAIALVWIGIHALIAGFTVYAASALLRRTAWTRIYFAGLMMLLAAESIGFGIYVASMKTRGIASAASLLSLRLGAGIGLCLIGLTAGLVAWKLLRDKGTKAAFGQGS